jgi:hypothetical protein
MGGMSEAQIEEGLAELAARLRHDPLTYAELAYPWGEGELKGKDGPREWQAQALAEIRDHLQGPDRHEPFLLARSSGHGIGKSAFISMVIDWSISTGVDTRVVATANTETQLRTKTWPEVNKWRRLSLFSHWFKTTATSITSLDPNHTASWRADAVPWSDSNTEAFAGLHNEGKRIILIFDEASNISDKVWEVAEGALTDENTEIIWIAFGNPTRNSGRFRECFRKFKHRWNHKQIDARTVEGTNKAQHQKWLEDWGEDSDFFRVRVRGEFPRASALQLIPSDWTAAARKREPVSSTMDPLIIGIDIARGGDDNNVILLRRGMDARSIPMTVIPGSETRDTTRFIAKVCTVVQDHKPDAVFVDATGVGGPVADQLRRLMPGVTIIDVNFASAAPDKHYTNMRTYMWWKMREALRSGLAIEDETELEDELTSPEYFHNNTDQMCLEKKSDIKKRLGLSPDKADALALTFAMPVMQRQYLTAEGGRQDGMQTEWDPYDQRG